MKLLRSLVVWGTLLGMSGCYLPASTNWYQFSGSFCGRETITERTCSVGFSLLTLPVQLGALAIDIPFSILEFVTGWAPFDQTLLETSELIPEPFTDEDGYLWVMQIDPLDHSRFLVTKADGEMVIDSYWLSRIDSEHIGLQRTVCADPGRIGSCLQY